MEYTKKVSADTISEWITDWAFNHDADHALYEMIASGDFARLYDAMPDDFLVERVECTYRRATRWEPEEWAERTIADNWNELRDLIVKNCGRGIWSIVENKIDQMVAEEVEEPDYNE